MAVNLEYVVTAHENPDTLPDGLNKFNDNFHIVEDHLNNTVNPHNVSLEQARIVNNALSGDLDLGGNYIKNIATPVDENDAVTKSYVDSATSSIAFNYTLTQDLDANNYSIKNLANPVNVKDAVNKGYVDDIADDLNTHVNSTNNPHNVSLEQARLTNNLLEGDIDINGHRIKNLADPVDLSDAVCKSYVDNHINNTSNPHSVTESQILSGKEALLTDGTRSMQDKLDMNNNRIINLLDPVGDQDAVTKHYLDTMALLADGSVSLTGNLDFNNHKGINHVDPSDPHDIVNKHYVDTTFLKADGSTPLTDNLNMNDHRIIDAADPLNPQDVATKSYVDNNTATNDLVYFMS